MAIKRRSRRRSSGRSGSNTSYLKLSNLALLATVIVLAAYILYPGIRSAVTGRPLGNTTAGIDTQLTPAQLAAINSAPNSYFERAGESLLNLTIPGIQESNGIYYGQDFETWISNRTILTPLIYNGKPSVIYIGAISCIYCAENRWAMALALSRFGRFGALYNGYSSIGDGDVPTLYWSADNYTTSGGATFGNSYTSNYVNFFSAEYDSPIKSGFQFPQQQNPIAYFVVRAPNQSYATAMALMNMTGAFQGTPFTFWGSVLNTGVDAVVFGIPNSTPSSTHPPLTYMSHAQILGELGAYNSTFAQEEYAAADVYVAELCPSLNNAAPACRLPAITAMEQRMGLG